MKSRLRTKKGPEAARIDTVEKEGDEERRYRPVVDISPNWPQMGSIKTDWKELDTNITDISRFSVERSRSSGRQKKRSCIYKVSFVC